MGEWLINPTKKDIGISLYVLHNGSTQYVDVQEAINFKLHLSRGDNLTLTYSCYTTTCNFVSATPP